MTRQDIAIPLLMVALAAMLATVPMWAGAAEAPAAQGAAQKPANEQVVVPQVDRREVRLPRMPSNDFEAGVFLGSYATQDFGTSLVAGLRLGYHLSEDFFVEGVLAQTKVSDESFRQILPGGVFADEKEKLTYYNLSVGYNVLPGEVFLGRRHAKASSLYVIGGIGSTRLAEQRKSTFNFGLGLRVFMNDRAALQVDMRDHVFSLDLLGKRRTTQNLELTGGLTFFF